ncbi:MarR family transcriptional regulator [Candidatus Woesearchaeota archaeon]|nr:MarR family transcriptional regulator [Candidatus Woesearchaeota archaeon]
MIKNNKSLGIIIVALSAILLYIMVSFSLNIAKSEAVACVHPGGGPCPITAHIPLASYFGFLVALTIGILGFYIFVNSGVTEKMQKEVAEKIRMAAKGLQGDEKKAYEIIAASDGAIFQAELVEKMEYAKVKVSRILDKLEGKGLIERRRRGLANMVLIKYH